MLKDNIKLFEDTLAADLGRPQLEARMWVAVFFGLPDV